MTTPGSAPGRRLLPDCRASGGAVTAGPLDRFPAASNGQVAWRDVAVFTLLALLVLRVVATLAKRPSRRAEQGLGSMGALLVAGYLGERLVRQRLRPSGWDPLESPLLVVAITLAAAMAGLGLRRPRKPATA